MLYNVYMMLVNTPCQSCREGVPLGSDLFHVTSFVGGRRKVIRCEQPETAKLALLEFDQRAVAEEARRRNEACAQARAEQQRRYSEEAHIRRSVRREQLCKHIAKMVFVMDAFSIEAAGADGVWVRCGTCGTEVDAFEDAVNPDGRR
jgi:hypothetical protein